MNSASPSCPHRNSLSFVAMLSASHRSIKAGAVAVMAMHIWIRHWTSHRKARFTNAPNK